MRQEAALNTKINNLVTLAQFPPFEFLKPVLGLDGDQLLGDELLGIALGGEQSRQPLGDPKTLLGLRQ